MSVEEEDISDASRDLAFADDEKDDTLDTNPLPNCSLSSESEEFVATGVSPFPRSESEQSTDVNLNVKEAAGIALTDSTTTKTLPKHVSEDRLIHSNAWVERNFHSKGDQVPRSHPTCSKVKKCYESKPCTYVIFVAVALIILLPEVYTLLNLPDIFNYAYDSIMLVNGACLIADIMLAAIFTRGYVLRFYFWADVIGTASIVFDIRIFYSNWVADLEVLLPSLVILRSTRMARIGKLLRVQRAIRSIRLVRIMRLLKIEKFSDALTQAATLGILVIVCLHPVLTFSTWTAGQPDTYMLVSLAKGNTPDTEEAVLTWFEDYPSKWHTIPVVVNNFNETWTNPEHPYHSSSQDGPPYGINQNINALIWTRGDDTEVILDRTWSSQIEAGMQLGVMMLVLGALAGLSAYIYRRVHMDILLPIGSVFHMIDQVIPGVFSEDSRADHAEDHINELAVLVSKLSRIAGMAHATEKMILRDIDNSNADDSTKAFIMKQFLIQDEREEDVEAAIDGDDEAQRIKMARRTSSMVAFRHRVSARDLDPETQVHIKVLNSLNFCCYDYNTSELMSFARLILETEGFLSEFNVPDDIATQFIERVRHGYEEIPYHSFYHAVDVMQTLFYFFKTINADVHADRLHLFCGLLAAIGHDIGHGGVNNSFLVRSRDNLAMVYNDISVLENMHSATLFTIISDPQFNILCGMPPQMWCKARKVIVQSILSTDMSHHFKLISETELFFELNETKLTTFLASLPVDSDTKDQSESKIALLESPFQSPQCQLKLVPLLLHAADISNPAKPFEIYSKHAERVMEEFFRQGEKEAQCGLDVSPMFDRSTSSLAKAQVGFIEFAVGPMYAALLKIFPKLRTCTQNLVSNREKYAQINLSDLEEEARERQMQQNKVRHRAFIKKFNARSMTTFAAAKMALVQQRFVSRRKLQEHRSSSMEPRGSKGSLFEAKKKSFPKPP